ncbi:arsenate reductase/protein-tyrosine-phosphatase family protein [Brevibacterium pigmentatum]|jgi:protein-tyrosine phosphatase|uniref:arsenate reductase/protein-tyrosine-phosphatase family protein n=1 Tax=Brevibacterium pigmentatum TaxID=1496080 RepID=UPI00141DCE42|nr:low molecular weight phosphatase family protein [Brevibacterium pigmentatum]
MSESFTVLTVCTGNLCRSRLAELVLAQRFADVSEIRLRSAGTRAAPGRMMPEEAREVAGFMGVINIRAQRARQVSEDSLSAADLVLVMTREHRRAVVELNPRIVRRTFTIRELASLAAVTRDDEIVSEGALPSADRATRLRAAVGAAVRRRSRRRAPDLPTDDDVIDPYGCDRDIYALAALQLAPAVEGVAVLFQRALNLGEEE